MSPRTILAVFSRDWAAYRYSRNGTNGGSGLCGWYERHFPHFPTLPLTSLRFSPSRRYGHWLATGTQLWQSGDESQGSYRVPNHELYLTLLDRSGSFRRQKVHLPCDLRGTRGKRRARHDNYRC